MRRDVFQAIADPTRRKIINVLAGTSLSLNAVLILSTSADRPFKKHVKILTECGLIVIKEKAGKDIAKPNLIS
jgi:DNA-binding transcriptional ArsR family regulator